MNKVILSGNLCRDIELKYTASNNAFLKNVIAVKNDFKTGEEYLSEFINIVVWNHNAEYLNKYATKGSKILIEGRMTNRSYDKQDGTKGYITEVIVEKAELLRSPNNSDTQIDTQVPSQDPFSSEIEISDDDLPF